MSGSLLFQGKYIVWSDPFSSVNFIHVLDAATGQELLSFRNVGEGPQDFTSTMESLTYDSQLLLCDINMHKQAYVRLEKLDSDSLKIFSKWEKKDAVDYQITNGIMKMEEGAGGRIHGATLTKDYIVISKKDETVEKEFTDAEKDANPLKQLPSSLFLYDYDYNLCKIINFEAPIIRISGDVHSNTLYAIVVNPEYVIVKMDLPE